MKTERSHVFISFRRIRYHEASVAYRDLLLSGINAWFSDHCVSASEAVKFSRDPTVLEGILRQSILSAHCILIIADKGYFESLWTLFEFGEVCNHEVPVVVAWVDKENAPDIQRLQTSVRASITVRRSLEDAVKAVCQKLNRVPVPFVGKRLWYQTSTVQAFGFSFDHPAWLRPNRFGTELRSQWGDRMWMHRSPVTDDGGRKISELMLGGSSEANSGLLFELIEADLWSQANRSLKSSENSLIPIGYHKFAVLGLRSTGIALSIQLKSGIGFCRYASIIVPEQMIRLELAYFVSGSRQRFMLLCPELDCAITTMQDSQAESLNGDELWRRQDAPWLATAKSLDSDNLVFVECDGCGCQLSWPAILDGKCTQCGGYLAKCATIGCSNPWRLGIKALQVEAFRESRLAARGRVSARSVYDKGVLCESCRCSLYIPGTMVARLIGHPTQSVPVIVNHRPALWMFWTIGCVYRIFFVGGDFSNYLISTIAFVTTIEPFDPKADDPMSGMGKLLHSLTVIPLILTLTAIFGNMDYSRSLIALAGSFAILLGTIQGFSLRVWYRKKHWFYSSITAWTFVLAVAVRVFSGRLGNEVRMFWAAIIIAGICGIASMCLRWCRPITGELNPKSLWAYKNWF